MTSETKVPPAKDQRTDDVHKYNDDVAVSKRGGVGNSAHSESTHKLQPQIKHYRRHQMWKTSPNLVERKILTLNTNAEMRAEYVKINCS